MKLREEFINRPEKPFKIYPDRKRVYKRCLNIYTGSRYSHYCNKCKKQTGIKNDSKNK